MENRLFMPGDLVLVKATKQIGTVSGLQDNPGKIRVGFDASWQGYFKAEELEHCCGVRKQEFKTDEDDLKELDSLLAQKREWQPKSGDVFEAFGAAYLAVNIEPDDVCSECVFRDAHCELNVDIPCCATGVVFKRVVGADLMVVDSNGKDIGRVERFVDNELRVENWANPISLYDFVRKGDKLEVRVKLVKD